MESLHPKSTQTLAPGLRNYGNNISSKSCLLCTTKSTVVIFRTPSSMPMAVSPGSNSVSQLPAPAGGCYVAQFTVSGSNTLTIS